MYSQITRLRYDYWKRKELQRVIIAFACVIYRGYGEEYKRRKEERVRVKGYPYFCPTM